ncbi:hypothetical protein [Oceanobacillus sp. MO10714A]
MTYKYHMVLATSIYSITHSSTGETNRLVESTEGERSFGYVS